MESAPTDPGSLQLFGEKAVLRSHRAQDAEAAYGMLHDEERILRWLTWAGPGSVAELEAYYGDWRFRTENGDDIRLAIVDRELGVLAGSLALRFCGHPDVADIGYWVGTHHQGRGLGSEAVLLACHLAFRHLGANAMFAWVFQGNEPSRRILEKCGFLRVRGREIEIGEGGGKRREDHLSLVRHDWEERFVDWHPVEEKVSELE